jgi:hypothetical protein
MLYIVHLSSDIILGPCIKGRLHNTNTCVTVKNVKCTLLQELRLCTGRTAHRGNRGIALLFHDHGTRSGWGVSVTPRLLFTPGKDPISIVQEAGWVLGPVWTGAEYLAPTGIWSPDRPARSQSLYRLRYPAHTCVTISLSYSGYVFRAGVSCNIWNNSSRKSYCWFKLWQ